MSLLDAKRLTEQKDLTYPIVPAKELVNPNQFAANDPRYNRRQSDQRPPNNHFGKYLVVSAITYVISVFGFYYWIASELITPAIGQ